MKRLILVLGILLSAPSFAAIDRCSTPTLSSAEIQRIESQFKFFEKIGLKFENSFDPNGELVKVYVHVISSGLSPEEGNVSDEAIANQIRIMNEAYSGLNSGHNTLFRFELAGIDRTVNTDWFNVAQLSNAEKQMKKALRVGGAADLNIYLIGDNGHTFGWGSFPWSYQEEFKEMDGIVINHQTLLGGRYGDKFSLGLTAVHEAGHWLGLYHTFQEGCRDGDGVKDTSPEREATLGCPAQKQTCGESTFDPIHNYMDYSDDSCMSEFTAGQVVRMTQLFVQYRKAK